MEKQATQPLIEPPSPDKELGHRRDKKNSPFELANCPKHPVLVAGAAIAVLLAAVFGFNTMKLRNRRPSTELKPVVVSTHYE
ncbi:hypothetical protein BIW11_08082 [Tropilaelaps mercedesae]|uniref:Uncharacterized protein n=1 Tax=Tropilaelaps mercedesae TaxID=418985 RepID=A0A1V9XRA0_9ACAR|nr:hypothetical protein BIW11_08082 [Tropilaelaps mercedesae]